MKEIEASKGRNRVTYDGSKIFVGSGKINHVDLVTSKMVKKGKVKAIYYLTKAKSVVLSFVK